MLMMIILVNMRHVFNALLNFGIRNAIMRHGKFKGLGGTFFLTHHMLNARTVCCANLTHSLKTSELLYTHKNKTKNIGIPVSYFVIFLPMNYARIYLRKKRFILLIAIFSMAKLYLGFRGSLPIINTLPSTSIFIFFLFILLFPNATVSVRNHAFP